MTFISTNQLIARAQYALKITFIFILILFLDSVNRVYRVSQDVEEARADIATGQGRSELQARKFYSQRNMYLCGFTLFLSLILNRTYVLIVDVLRLEGKVRAYESESTGVKKAGLKNQDEISALREELRLKEQDFEILKKQSEGLSNEYNKLGDQINLASGLGGKKTK